MNKIISDNKIRINALHADRTVYRWWESEIELVNSNCIVTRNTVGDLVHELDKDWKMEFNSRGFYWTQRPLNMFEIYTIDGEPEEIYINIASTLTLDNKTGSYFDYELDVSKKRDQPIVILDEEEFMNAIEYYHYSNSFVSECRESLELAITLAERWEWRNTFHHLREFGQWGD